MASALKQRSVKYKIEKSEILDNISPMTFKTQLTHHN